MDTVKNEYQFKIQDTNIVKGIAILLMVFHHTYPNNPGIPIYLQDNVNCLWIIATCGKVCVSLLTILSGYGLSESYKKKKSGGLNKQIRFFVSHYIQLISMYWCILLWSYITAFLQGSSLIDIYGAGKQGIINFIFDSVGIGDLFNTPVYIGGWYLSAIIVFYALFPLLNYLIKKIGWLTLVLSYLPWIYYIYKNDINMHTDWWLFYLFSFVIGIFLSQKQILIKLKKIYNGKKGILGVVVFFIVAVVARVFLTLPMDSLLAISVVLGEVFILSRFDRITVFLCKCGKQSANIWLIQVVLIRMIDTMSFVNYVARYIFLMFFCLAVSITIEGIKNGIGYSNFVNKIRKTID